MDFNKSKEKSSLYQHIAALAANVPIGSSTYIDCPLCGRQRKFGMSHRAKGVVYQCFSSSCPLRGLVPNEGMPISKTKVNSILMGSTEESTTFSTPDHFIDGFASEDSLRMASQYDLLPAYSAGCYRTALDPRLSRQVFFHVDAKGDVVGAFGRALNRGIKPKAYVYPNSLKTPIILKNTSNELVGVVVEDMFSAAKVYNSGYTGISLSGTSISVDNLNYFRGFNRLIIALDKDATIKSLKLKRLLDFVCEDVVIVQLQKDLKDMKNENVKVLLGVHNEQ